MSEPHEGIDARPFPHDLAAERAVLGSILIRPDVIFDVAERVQSPDFYRDAHQRVLRHLLAMSLGGITIDALTLRESLEASNELEKCGGFVYLASLTDGVPHSTNAVAYASIVREKAGLRRLMFAGQKLIAMASEGGAGVSDVLETAQRDLFGIADGQTLGCFTAARELMPDVLAAVEQLVKEKRAVTGVPTGFVDLDAMTRGLQPGDLIIVAGRPSMGKTSLAMNVAQHAAMPREGRVGRVAVFSLEMNKKSLGLRLLASEARINHHRMLSGYVSDGDWGKVSNALGRLAESGILIDDTSTATPFDVRAKARRLQADGGLDLIVIDYLQLMNGSQKAENKNLEVAGISKALKAIARDLNVPVMVLSQLSRESDRRGDHRPMLSDLRDSGALEQDADVVMFVHRPEKYGQTDDNRGVAELILAKQRNGPTGMVRLQFTDHLVRFDNAARTSQRQHYAEDLA